MREEREERERRAGGEARGLGGGWSRAARVRVDGMDKSVMTVALLTKVALVCDIVMAREGAMHAAIMVRSLHGMTPAACSPHSWLHTRLTTQARTP